MRKAGASTNRHACRRTYLISTAAITATAAATAKVSLDHGLGFINGQHSSVQLGTAELSNRLVRAVRHCHEPKAFGSACFAVRDDGDRFNRAVLCKCIIEIVFRRLERQISNKNLFRHLLPICKGTSGTL